MSHASDLVQLLRNRVPMQSCDTCREDSACFVACGRGDCSHEGKLMEQAADELEKRILGPNEPQLLKAIEDAVNTFAYIANHGGDPYGSKEHMRVEDYDVLRQVAEAAGKKCEELNALHKRLSATNDRQEKA